MITGIPFCACQVLHLSLQQMLLNVAQSASQQSLELSLGHMQIDSALQNTSFPVILAPLASEDVVEVEQGIGTAACLQNSLFSGGGVWYANVWYCAS